MATKFTDEQLLALSNAGFSAEEISLFQFDPSYAPNESELNSLTACNSIKQALDELPYDIPDLIERIQKTYGILIEQNLPKAEINKKIALLAKKDPALAKQTAVLLALVDYSQN